VFIGHFALGLASKRLAPRVSLGALFLACQFADLLWPLLVLAGAEWFTVLPGITAVTPLDFQHYPWSHSLLTLAVWGALLGVAHRAVTGSDWGTAFVLAGLVASHWVLDLITHRPDMPLAPGLEPRFGLGLWHSIPGTLAVEFLLLAIGAGSYFRSTMARDRVGSIGLWALLAFLCIVEVANAFGPPPPDVRAVAWSAQAMWLLVLWGYWVDRHRSMAWTLRSTSTRAGSGKPNSG
jgi:hypothetical protein